jgi:HEAT repeat protein
MKKKLIILVEIVVLIVFLRSEFAAYFIEDIRVAITNKIDAISNLPEKRELSQLKETLDNQLSDLNEAQTGYLIDITSTNDKLKRFYYLYCVNKDINPYLFAENLTYTCTQINRSGILKK